MVICIFTLCAESQTEPVYCPPTLIELEFATVFLNCSATTRAERVNCDVSGVRVRVNAVHPKNKKLQYSYRTSRGNVIGEGAEVEWNVEGLPPGLYDLSVVVTGPGRYRREGAYTLTIQPDEIE